jgi:3-dehydroquinate synthase
MEPTRLEVAAASGPYPVIIAPRALDTLTRLLDRSGLGPRRFIVSSPLVWQLHGSAVRRASTEPEPILIPDGERFKTLHTVGRVYDALLRSGADRSTVLVALGGGVIGDVAGFAAATFLRGIRVAHLPTTLLAQVDSAIGGKTGVNHTLGKNLIGAFHSPCLVVVDPCVLGTLPRRELRGGLYEIVKYGIIASAPLFDRVRASLAKLFARDEDSLSAVIAESCRIKAEIVSADEREGGLRRVLNFGHTIGHALEAATKYRRLRHGEAVAYGMMAATALGVARGITPKEVHEAVRALIATMGPLPPIADLPARDVLGAVHLDKKMIAGTLHFVAATEIGRTTTLTDVSPKELGGALKAIGIRR